MFKKSLATAALAVIAVFAFAPAANAVDYTPTANGTTQSAVVAGGTVAVNFPANAFVGTEQVKINVVGSHAATLSVVASSVTSTITKAAVNGAVSVNVKLAANATGTYKVTATGVDSNRVGTSALTIAAADAGTAAKGLASTGYNAPVLVIWGAAGLLILGAALVAVRISVRRQHAAA